MLPFLSWQSLIDLLREASPALRQQDRNILWLGSRHPMMEKGVQSLVVFKVRSVLRVPKRGVVDVELGSFPCPVEPGVVRRPPPPIETDFRMSSHFYYYPNICCAQRSRFRSWRDRRSRVRKRMTSS